MKIENKKLNVLYILTKLELGGAQKVCLSLMQGLKDTGGTPSLISGTEGPLVDQAKKFDSVYLLKNFKREVGIFSFYKEFLLFFQLIKQIRKIKKQNPNLIVHTHSTKAGLVGRWAAFFAGVKNRMHTVHGFGFHEYQNKIAWIINYLLELITSFVTTHYICVSKNDQNTGKKLIPFFGKKSSVINAAVDYEKFYIPTQKTSDITSDRFILGTTSCFKPQKNLFDLLKAFKLTLEKIPNKKNSILLQILGDGEQRTDIENWIKQNNLKNNIELLGWQNNVSEWMKNWNLFVMSSLWEGLPCAIVEARLSKLPVIAYAISGIPEVIFNNKNGFLVKAKDWKGLSKKIQMVISNHNLWKDMSNYEDDLKSFHNLYMINSHLALYKQQMKNK